ncbi:glycosyltransferase [Pseudorhodoplanes sp.]|uniref:glycosyltransferase n=1 Tax=Pseudorhodoplanes sp. TaxID=1934341 RepID=UPI002C10E4CF|nr:glycosyltransferase [Pseudorhodoplanes sp.]HWV54432.1 glycosyltransferase [Pseudorhodoplanes sp.]
MSATRRICFPFVGDSVGGAHLSTLLLIEGLDRSRFEPMIVLHTEGPLAEHLRQRQFEFITLPLNAFAGATPRLLDIVCSALKAAPKLSRFIRERRIDIVHANDLRMNLTWPLAAKLSGAKMVWHQRTTPASNSMLWKAIPYLANETIAISDPVAEALGPMRRNVEVVYNPFRQETTFNKAEQRTALLSLIGAPDSSVVLGSVGRLVRYKRADICIDVVAELQRRFDRPVHGVLLGADPEGLENELKEYAWVRGVGDRMHFLGFRYPVEKYLSGMDVLVSPSEFEGFGRSLVEAMLVETPVVASRVGGHVDIVRHEENGFLVPPGEVKAFADMAEIILRDDARRVAITNCALESAYRRFSDAAHVSALQQIYDRLVPSI